MNTNTTIRSALFEANNLDNVVTILLATHNGEKYLAEQLESIIQQSYKHWKIVASDDGSTDNTLSILRDYQNKLGETRFVIKHGPCQGFCANFMALARDPSLDSAYFAFCDQDDRWHSNHLQRALSWLTDNQGTTASLYCGRTRLVNKNGHYQGESTLRLRTPSFRNALIQSLAGGNTMVFNTEARNLLIATGDLPVVSHDWWIYMLVSGANGQIKYHRIPSIDYRQHGKNIVGSNVRFRDQFSRLMRMSEGQLKEWNNTNLESLSQCMNLLTNEHRQTLDAFVAARKKTFFSRCVGVFKSGVHRQSISGDLGLIAATILGKI
ncbi:MAG: glycosyltransferase family 2 protein [Pseudomonas sp.]|uniref:glycosyltransferase family 2 protein n=1 Tax=Pseudomonas sp. TaxID=306 RepID=UPI003BB52B32